MTASWAARLPASSAGAAASLRLRPGVEACEAAGELWLRGTEGGEVLARELRRLPGAERFDVLAGGRLRVPGARVPCGAMPPGPWAPAAAWAMPAAAEAARPGELTQRVMARLEPSDAERPAGVLRVPLAAFTAWAAEAPAARLRPLAFAASAGEALVRGNPLPPLPGALYAEREGIAVPCGWALAPAAGDRAWRERLGLSEGDLALFSPGGSFERIPAAAWARASRSAARAAAHA